MFLFSSRPSTYYIYSRNYTGAFCFVQYNKTEKGFVRQWNYQPQGNGISTWASKRVWIRGINLAGLITDKFLWFLGSSCYVYISSVYVLYIRTPTNTHILARARAVFVNVKYTNTHTYTHTHTNKHKYTYNIYACNTQNTYESTSTAAVGLGDEIFTTHGNQKPDVYNVRSLVSIMQRFQI